MPAQHSARSSGRSGFSLLEMVVVLTVTGVLLAIALPRMSAVRDRSAVRSAVDELGASFSTARAAAIARRAMVAVVVDTSAGVVEVRSAGRIVVSRPLRALYGISLMSNRDSAVYDQRGLGYGVTNLTVVVRRGAMVDTLTMSRLGRVRW
ncbi:MAG: prepilin-type N-terminal cleavage/methylation domain-containing protein [Gemmatimonadaceae bacterium]